jgi:threonine dehydrogenase-like Zn-dependent dehydrogenase
MAVAALRHAGSAPERLVVVAKHRHQAGEARRLGADSIIEPDDLLDGLRRILGSGRLQPELGPAIIEAGVDQVIDAVGSAESLQAAVRILRPRGQVTLLGMPGPMRVDLAPLWQRELDIRGAYAYGAVTFEAALELASKLRLARLVGPIYALEDYRDAIATALSAGRLGHVKVAFRP